MRCSRPLEMCCWFGNSIGNSFVRWMARILTQLMRSVWKALHGIHFSIFLIFSLCFFLYIWYAQRAVALYLPKVNENKYAYIFVGYVRCMLVVKNKYWVSDLLCHANFTEHNAFALFFISFEKKICFQYLLHKQNDF